jgi:2-polyprenyl-3-methyl-5-hydroxy-6-metoxy-1,4-benzoquinol methylase
VNDCQAADVAVRRAQVIYAIKKSYGSLSQGIDHGSQASSVLRASDGAAYELKLGRWSSRLANVFLDFVDFPDNGELLDVGCGTGALTLAMAQRWPDRQ